MASAALLLSVVELLYVTRFSVPLILRVCGTDNNVHIVGSSNTDRVDWKLFRLLISSLKRKFKNHLMNDMNNQSTYVYRATQQELVEAIKSFDNSIKIA